MFEPMFNKNKQKVTPNVFGRKEAKMYLKQLDREIKDKEFIVKNVGSRQTKLLAL